MSRLSLNATEEAAKMAEVWRLNDERNNKKISSPERARAYWQTHGKPAPGWARCMDCRCTGSGECSGETVAYQTAWFNQKWD